MTVKNIQCMRGLLNMAHCHGDISGTVIGHTITSYTNS